MPSPCTQYLRSCARELNYILWRADVHRLSVDELNTAWQRISQQLREHCPAGHQECGEFARLLTDQQAKLNYLLEKQLQREQP